MSIGGRAASGSSASTQYGSDVAGGKGGSYQTQDVYAPQAGQLDNAYSMIGSGAQNAQDSVMDFIGNQGFTGQAGQSVENLAGMSDPNALIQAQSASLQSGLNDIYQQGLTNVGDSASNAGAFGGGRHGIQEAALGGEIGDAYTQGLGDITANAYNTAINANNSAISGANTGYNMGLQNALAGLAPGSAYVNALGSPTVLGTGGSYDANIASGYDFGNSQSQDSSAGFGFGLK